MNNFINLCVYIYYMLGTETVRLIYLLLVLAYLGDQFNQMYRYNFLNYQTMVSEDAQNILECLSQLATSFFAVYIIFKYKVDSALMRFFLIMFSIFYLINGSMSFLLLFQNLKDTIKPVNESIFEIEFIAAKFFAFFLFFLLYKILF